MNAPLKGIKISPEWVGIVRKQVESLRFGVVPITVHRDDFKPGSSNVARSDRGGGYGERGAGRAWLQLIFILKTTHSIGTNP